MLYINRKKIIAALILLLPVMLQAQTLHLRFINTVGDTIMQAGATYRNAFGETFNIRNFKYYITNISLRDTDGQLHPLTREHFLIDEADSASKTIVVSHNNIKATSIRFMLGVDSVRNISGVQTGALDPMKGMFWTWNSGYIMAKLEGKSAASKSLGNYFTYHVGGFKNGESASRWVELPLEKIATVVIIKADADKWFNALQAVKIAEHPICHEPGKLAMLIADNYAQMFSVWKSTDQ